MEWYVESVGSSVFCVDARHAGAIFPAEALEMVCGGEPCFAVLF